jgi:tetratricopeptide (TPR) repeat protein
VGFEYRSLIAALTVAALALIAAPSTAQEPQAVDGREKVDAQLERARAIATHAERLFDAGHFAASLAEYTRAYDALAGHPRQYFVLYNLAACNERLFHYDLALAFYEQYLERAPESEQDRAQVAAIMQTLRGMLGTLVVESSVPAAIWIDDRQLGAAPGRWLVPAGRHVVEARAALHESPRKEVQLAVGQMLELRFEPQRLSTNTGPRPGYFWATTALTGAAMVSGTVFGLLALSARQDGQARAQYYLDAQQEAERTRSYALAADISFGSAALLGASATVLYFITDWTPGQPQPSKGRGSSGATRSVALIAPGGPGAALQVAF